MIESFLVSDPPLIIETWIRIRGCYKDSIDCLPPPSIVSLDKMKAEREDLYLHILLPGEPISGGELPLSVDDGIPEDEEITWLARSLCLNLLGGPSGMRAEHLRQWPIAATRNDLPEATSLLKVFATIQVVFHDGTMAEECT